MGIAIVRPTDDLGKNGTLSRKRVGCWGLRIHKAQSGPCLLVKFLQIAISPLTGDLGKIDAKCL